MHSASYLLLLAEAIVCAPLWAIAHLHADGEGFAGGGSNGYSIVTGLVLRPILIVIGFALSIQIGTVACGLLDTLFLPTMKSATQGHLAGLGMIVFMVTTYVSMKTAILVSSLKIVTIFPEAVARWISPAASGSHAAEAVGAASGVHQADGTTKLIGQQMMSQVNSGENAAAAKRGALRDAASTAEKSLAQAGERKAAGDNDGARRMLDRAQGAIDQMESGGHGKAGEKIAAKKQFSQRAAFLRESIK